LRPEALHITEKEVIEGKRGNIFPYSYSFAKERKILNNLLGIDGEKKFFVD